MRIHAEVDVVNRQLACHGIKGKGKKMKSHLAIGRKPLAEGNSEVFLMLTNNTSKQGVKYLIKNNVETMFTKMINEGKSTVRFKEPPHDLCIKCEDKVQLKSFLMTLKKVIEGKVGAETLSLSALQPASSKQIEGPKKKLSVLKRGDYPKEGFPSTLTQLQVSGVRLARVDNRMLKLRFLVKLDLSDNEITSLPDNWDLLDLLSDLDLSDNQIDKLPRQMCVGRLASSLKQLNLSGNKIVLLPNYFCNLKSLITVNLNKNNLKALPPSIGKLTNLKHLQAADNHIQVLPGSFSRLRLETLELSGNNFDPATEPRTLRDRLEPVSSLLELAAVHLVTHNVQVGADDVHTALLQYLDSGMRCLCSKPVWTNVAVALVSLDLGKVASQISIGGLDSVCIEAQLCSQKCLQLFMKNPYAF